MKSLRPLAATLLAASTLPLLPVSCSEAEAPPPRETDDSLYVLVIVDTLRWDALGCYGKENAGTPRIDALAAGGVRFDQAISSSGWTLPSVASMLTGTWPELHKATGKMTRLTPISGDLPVAAEVFRDAGYATLGVANAAFLSPLLGFDRGFDRFDHRHAFNVEIRRADETVEDALAAIEAHGGEGMFALVHIFDPHLNYDPPKGHYEAFTDGDAKPPGGMTMMQCMEALNLGKKGGGPPDPEGLERMLALYQGEIAFVDQAIGQLIDGLERIGIWDRTTLVLTSDHGEEFYDHQGFEHGHTLYDELIRVPLVVRFPQDRPGAGTVVADPVRTVDIAPTLFDLAGIEPPASFIGRSLLPVVAGVDDAPRPAFGQSTLYGAEKFSWRDDQYHLIYDRSPDAEKMIELYDWTIDPMERHDLSDEMPAVVEEIKARMSTFYSELRREAQTISTPQIKDMSPTAIKKYVESIEKLGYAGRDHEEEDETER